MDLVRELALRSVPALPWTHGQRIGRPGKYAWHKEPTEVFGSVQENSEAKVWPLIQQKGDVFRLSTRRQGGEPAGAHPLQITHVSRSRGANREGCEASNSAESPLSIMLPTDNPPQCQCDCATNSCIAPTERGFEVRICSLNDSYLHTVLAIPSICRCAFFVSPGLDEGLLSALSRAT